MVIERFQAGVRLSLVDCLFDRRVQEALDGWVKVIKRYKYADLIDRNGLRRRLKSVEHRPFSTGQVHTCRASFANRLKDFLDELKLVRRERVVFDKILGVLVLTESHTAVLKRELALEDVASVARLMSPKSMASFTLLSKNSTACLLWPLLV